jgi:hypothetical protein
MNMTRPTLVLFSQSSKHAQQRASERARQTDRDMVKREREKIESEREGKNGSMSVRPFVDTTLRKTSYIGHRNILVDIRLLYIRAQEK